MVGKLTSTDVFPKLPNLDARSIVPVEDEVGGVVVYFAGRPAYYVLNGEWFEAISTDARPINTCDSERNVRVF